MGGKVRIKTTKFNHTKPGLRLHKFSPTPYRYFALASGAFVFAFLVASLLAPVQISDAQEVTLTNNSTGYYVTVTSADNVNLEVDASPSGQLAVAKDTINVKTNVPTGYQLYLSSSSANLSKSSTEAYTPVDGTLDDPAALTKDTWGFSLEEQDLDKPVASDTWAAVSTSTTLIHEEEGSTGSSGVDTPIYFGVNATTNLPAGDYAATITYTALAEGAEPEEDMSEFTLAECLAMETGATKTLIDSRDTVKKSYGIIKAADGNCWMTDNMKYDLVESSTWNSNITDEAKLHIAENDGYSGEYYYNYAAALSVCPTGWSLPIYGDSSTNYSYAKLLNSYGITTGAQLLAQTELGFTKYYGNWDWSQNTEVAQGSFGNFWSATASSTTNAYYFYYGSSSVYPQADSYKGGGRSVRCVFTGQTSDQMQEFTVNMCENMTELSSKTLVDRRNGETYGIVKAKDGHCWMTDNLDLYNTTVSADDSNFTSGTFTLPASSTWSNNVTSEAKLHVATNSGYEGEVYYNWYAATAGSTESNDGVSANTSICPKGWRLPINGDETQDLSWAKLMNAHGLTTGAGLLNEKGLGFDKYYGYWGWQEASEGAQGSYGYFWSSTPSSASNAYYFAYDSTTIYPQGNLTKGYGRSIRCVFDDRTIEDLTYMQEMTPEVCSNTATSTTTTLLDKRGRGSGGSDKTTGYGVVKAKDGNCWMTDNLELYDIALTTATSDVAAAFTLPASSTWNTNIYNAAKLHVATASGYAGEVYYNWCSAVALTTTCDTTEEQSNSICPKEWRLPVNGEYGTLMDSYDITTGAELLAETELGFDEYYGNWYFVVNKEFRQGSDAYFWSSTPYSDGYAYNFDYFSTNFYPNSQLAKSAAFSIRCVAR